MKCTDCGYEGDFYIKGEGIDSVFMCPFCEQIPTQEKFLKYKEKIILAQCIAEAEKRTEK